MTTKMATRSAYRSAVGIISCIVMLTTGEHTTVDVDLTAETTPFSRIWQKSFGSGHAKLTVRPDWQDHLKRAVNDLGLKGVRYHGLFDDDMGPVVTNSSGQFKYNFTKIDVSWDYQISLGVVPIVELSFMPAVLAGCSWTPPDGGPVINPGFQPCRGLMAYKGIDMQPTNYNDWAEIVIALATHAVERYGIETVREWHFEVWNELWGMPFPSAYMQLFNASSVALKSVDTQLKIGGPATAQLDHVVDFINAATEANIPFDFVSTHMYPTDPQCSRGVEWSPDCFSDNIHALRKKIDLKIPLFITEYNVGCCLGYNQHDTSGAAAFIFRQMEALVHVTDVLSWWTFSDVFEEGGFPNTEFSNIYGLMTVHGIPKPGWRAFQLLNLHSGSSQVATTVTGHSMKSPVSEQSTLKAVVAAPNLNSIRSDNFRQSDLTCFIENNTNLAGFDILPDSQHLMLPTPAECCAACRNHTGSGGGQTCTFWTYAEHGDNLGRCYLKTSDAGRTQSSDYTSGSTVAPPPPPPPAQLVSALATANSTDASASVAVFLGLWVNGGDPSNQDNRSVTVNLKRDSSNGADVTSLKAAAATAYVIDSTHANPYGKWMAMGSPAQPTEQQLAMLMKESEVTGVPIQCDRNSETGMIMDQASVVMTPNSAILIVFE